MVTSQSILTYLVMIYCAPSLLYLTPSIPYLLFRRSSISSGSVCNKNGTILPLHRRLNASASSSVTSGDSTIHDEGETCSTYSCDTEGIVKFQSKKNLTLSIENLCWENSQWSGFESTTEDGEEVKISSSFRTNNLWVKSISSYSSSYWDLWDMVVVVTVVDKNT